MSEILILQNSVKIPLWIKNPTVVTVWRNHPTRSSIPPAPPQPCSPRPPKFWHSRLFQIYSIRAQLEMSTTNRMARMVDFSQWEQRLVMGPTNDKSGAGIGGWHCQLWGEKEVVKWHGVKEVTGTGVTWRGELCAISSQRLNSGTIVHNSHSTDPVCGCVRVCVFTLHAPFI